MSEFDLKIGVKYVHYRSLKTVMIVSFGLVQMDDVWHPSVNYRIVSVPATPANVASGVDTETLFTRTRADFAAKFEPSTEEHASIDSDSESLDLLARQLRDEFGESLVEESNGEADPYNWWLQDVTVADIIDFIKTHK